MKSPHGPITDPLTRQWLDYLRAERKPENTIKRRESVLRAVGNAGTATRDDIEAWWSTRRDKSPSTRANDLASLRSFYQWCNRWDHRDDDPTRRLDPPKVDAGLPRPIGRAELRHLLDTLPEPEARAVALGAYAGLRVSEVAALNWDDIDLEARRARIMNSKGAKSRLVAVGAVLVDLLLPERPGCNVVTGTREVWPADTAQRRVNRAIKRAGVDATFHQLRHRYGTLAYQATHDLVAVGRQMGHSSPVTTAVYAAASDDAADVIADAVAR